MRSVHDQAAPVNTSDKNDGAQTVTTPADLRILQANERTALAWIRTSLALMAFGFVVARLGLWLREVGSHASGGTWSVWIGAVFLVLGAVCNATAALRYARIRRAILEGRAIIPGAAFVLIVALCLTALAAILVSYIVHP